MILVVYYHTLINAFGKEPSGWSINNFFATFRMPLFFFLSGFLMYKMNRFKSWSSLRDFLRVKVRSQIYPTVIFSLLFSLIVAIPYKSFLLNSTKYGYWFTCMLFCYFVIYAIGDFMLSKWTHGKNKIIIGSICAGFIYAIAKYSVIPICPWYNTPISGIMMIPNFQFFPFFYFGALARAYFKSVERLLCREKVVTIIIVSFFFLQFVLQFPYSKDWFVTKNLQVLYSLIQSFTGFLGIATFFIFFQKNEDRITNCRLGRVLRYVGERTLDIYLIHHILVFTDNMHFIGPFFAKYNSMISELIIGGIATIGIIGVCLAISLVIRCSDTLAKVLFGKVI